MAEVTDATQQGQVQMTAQQVNIMAAKEIAGLVRSTLGPMGMDKMLVGNDGSITVTNDGATILREMNVTHPTARMIIQVAKTQEAECYDGTTTAVILAGELMKQTESLIAKGIHPTMIVKGFKKAAKKALMHLDTLSLDNADDDGFRQVALTAMTGKSAEEDKEHLAELCVGAASAAKPADINIVVRPGAPVTDSYWTKGVIVDKSKAVFGMPDKVSEPRIAVLQEALILPALPTQANINFADGETATTYMSSQKDTLVNMAETIAETGANVVLCMKEIDAIVSEHLSRMGIYAARRVSASDLEAVAVATGATIVNSLDDLQPSDLGKCGAVEERSFELSPRPLLFLDDCPHRDVASIMVFAPTEHLAFEIGRAVDDAVGVVYVAKKDGKVLSGGGSAFMSMSLAVKEFASSVGGRSQLAVESFATALEVIPAVLAENSGLQPIDSLLALRVAHTDGDSTAYIDVETGEINTNCDVIEPHRVVKTALQAATDTACMILRIDNIITAKTPDEFGMV